MKTLRLNKRSSGRLQPRGMPLARGDLQSQLAGDRVLRSWIAGLVRENCRTNGFQGSGPPPRGSRPPTRDPVDRGGPSLGCDRARESIAWTKDDRVGLTFQYRQEFDVDGRGSTPPTRDVVDRGYFFPARGDPFLKVGSHAERSPDVFDRDEVEASGLQRWIRVSQRIVVAMTLNRGSTPPTRDVVDRGYLFPSRGDPPWHALRCWANIDCKPPGNIGVLLEGSSPPMSNNRGRESISLTRGAPHWSAQMEAESCSCTLFGINNNNRLRVSSTGVAVEEFSPNEPLALWNFGTPSLSWSVVGWDSLNYTNDITASGGELVNRLRFS